MPRNASSVEEPSYQPPAKKTRRATLVRTSTLASTGGFPSALPRPTVEQMLAGRLSLYETEAFQEFSSSRGLGKTPQTNEKEFEAAVVAYMDEQVSMGYVVDVGNNLLSAIGHQ